ncbi:MAG TPA: purine-nucleoside phosphorylase [Polyangiaceae bacterium]|nr:purine-nucleoside phosphorylase [Polyangiaceae bacterium]HYQ26841.1 purine-nucleoside phosphorylase [Polyangiaceae bacterium]
MPDGELQRVRLAAALVAERAGVRPRIGVVLGSGLGAFADQLSGGVRIPYAEIPEMPRSSVVGHAGNLCMGSLGSVPVACLQGRAHVYEGNTQARSVFGVRLLAELGCSIVLLTNAAGGIHASFAAGDLMLITDHLNLMGDNPLCGPNFGDGPRFPDMSRAYDLDLRMLARDAAREAEVTLREGVYAAMLGPSYETPAEIRMLRTLGADAVGMSTVPEVIALRQRGVRVGAVSCITNLAAGLSPELLDHSEVESTARRSRDAFTALLTRWVVSAGTVGS